MSFKKSYFVRISILNVNSTDFTCEGHLQVTETTSQPVGTVV